MIEEPPDAATTRKNNLGAAALRAAVPYGLKGRCRRRLRQTWLRSISSFGMRLEVDLPGQVRHVVDPHVVAQQRHRHDRAAPAPRR